MAHIIQNPRSSCALGGAVSAVSSIYRAVPIYHAGPGCVVQTNTGVGKTINSNYLAGSIPSSNMYEREIVFGGINRLKETIDGTLEVIDGDEYFVLTGCSADIIGDDAAGLVEEYRNKGIPIVHIETAGFKGDTTKGYESVLNIFPEKLASEGTGIEENTVNLFGTVPAQELFWSGNTEEIIRILNKLGIKVNSFFSQFQGVKEIKNSSNAALNINLSPWLCKETEKSYKSKFNIDTYHFNGLPIGPTATTAFVKGVTEKLNIDCKLVTKVISEEEGYVYGYYSGIYGYIRKYRFAIVGDTNTVLGITRFLVNDYSQIAVAAVITDEVPDTEKSSIDASFNDLEYPQSLKVFYEQDLWKIKQILKEQDIQIIFGSHFEREIADELHTIHFNISNPALGRIILNKGYTGYRGSLSLIEDIYYAY
ncbi:MAG: nitrogenase component 1 [Ruminiclostridium sp.]